MSTSHFLAFLVQSKLPLLQQDYREKRLAGLAGNPRVSEDLRRRIHRDLHAKVADARFQVQAYVTALVLGPAASAFGWQDDDWDRLAGAVVAGHILECGAQATGGNFSFFQEIADRTRPGFPIAPKAPRVPRFSERPSCRRYSAR